MRKLLFILILLSAGFTAAQKEYVPVQHYVYNYLERMDNLHIISNYNPFELPKTRDEISDYLKEVKSKSLELDETDLGMLEDLQTEFEYELKGTTDNSGTLFGDGSYRLFSDRQKYIYKYIDQGKGTIFLNILGSGGAVYSNNRNLNVSQRAALGIAGGEIRGTILNKFGFYLKGTNGKIAGDKAAAMKRMELRSNYKLNENPDETFFDETEGYLTADFDLIRFKIGRDRFIKGYSRESALLNLNSPAFDYISMDIKYGIFSFSYFHGKLLGKSEYSVSESGIDVKVAEKYAGYHRLGLNFSRHLNFGAGEFIIYGDRGPDFSYLNPFNFYKSVEHANRDRDNSILFLDVNNNSIKGLKLYSILLLDDISFSKIGSGWWGNQVMWNIGLVSDMLYDYAPVDIRLEYTRTEPYVFTHRLQRNSFANYETGLNSLQPNSGLFFSEINYRFNKRLRAGVSYKYMVHGANYFNDDGTYINTGGNLLQGHRVFDSEELYFLDGYKEYSRIYGFNAEYEPFNQIIINVTGELAEEQLQNMTRNEINIFAGINVIF